MAVELINLATPPSTGGISPPLTSTLVNSGNSWTINFAVGETDNANESPVEEGDLLLFVWSCERGKGGESKNPTSTTDNLHPTSGRTITLTNATNASGTATDWVDFGYGVHGQQNGTSTTDTFNQRGALGVYGKYVAATDVLGGGSFSFTGTFKINGLTNTNTWKTHIGLYCVRGMGSTTGTRDINALATLSRSTMFRCDMAGENYASQFPHGGTTDEVVWIEPQETSYDGTSVYGSGVSGFSAPTVMFFGAWRNSGADLVDPATIAPTRNRSIGTNYAFTSPMGTFGNADNGTFAASGATFEGGSWRNEQSHYNAYMYRKFASFSAMDDGWNGDTSSPKAFGYHLDNWANGPTCIAVILPEAAPTATNTPLSVTDEATSLDTFDLVVSRVVEFTDEVTGLETKGQTKSKTLPFTDEATGLETKDQTLAKVLEFTDISEVLETKDQTKSKTLPLTDEATAVETRTENFGYAESFTDEATPLDTAQKEIGKPFSDEAKGLEAYDKTISSLIIDSAEAVDTKGQIKSKALPLTEEAKSLDTAQKGIAKVFADEATGIEEFNKTLSSLIADSAEAVENSLKSISDFLLESADAVETKDKNFGYAEFFTDVTEALDSFGKTQGLGLLEEAEADTDLDLPEKNFTEEALALETFTTTRIYFLPITDSVETVDDPVLLKETPADNIVPFTEKSSTKETLVVTRVFNFPITDSVVTADDLDPDVQRAFTLEIADSASPVETKDQTHAKVLEFTDISEVLETKDQTLAKVLEFTDISEVLETEDQTHAKVLEFTDISEVLETKDQTLAKVLEFTDISEVLETKDQAFEWTRGFTDEVSTVNLFTKQAETVFTDAADVLDEPVFHFGFAVEFTDEAKGLDTAVIPGPAATRNFTESTSAADNLVFGLKIGLSLNIICEGILEGKSPPQLLTKEEALAIIDVYNIALNALGVGTLSGVNDGSPQATILNDTFDSFKRQFLTDYSWNGAKKTVALSRLQDYNATDVKPVGDRWSYAYLLPNDYLRVLRINGYERYNRTQNHLQNAFEIEVVNYATSATETSNKRCLLTEEPTVNLEYIFEPTDDDLTILLGSQTEHALGLSFAHYIARNFGKTPQEIAVLSDESRRAITAAKGVDGQEKTQRLRPDLGLVESRYWWRG